MSFNGKVAPKPGSCRNVSVGSDSQKKTLRGSTALDRTKHPDAVPGRRVRGTRLQLGQPFNPFGLFNGIWIPEALVKCTSISAGAKLAFGRLARYAGQDGRCYPAVSTLASEIGLGARQAQKYLSELEKVKLIRRVSRFKGH